MDFQTVFLIGAPRSGTTWLQHMLGSHPQIVTTQETDLFSGYISSLWWWWSFHVRETRKGLPAVLTESEFDSLIANLINETYQKIMDLKPSATILLEKDPPYSLHIDLILRHVPKARFIHIIRDGRDVASSLMAASQGWGRSWAPSGLEDAVTMWKNYVTGAKRAADSGNPYVEVRYEDLMADGAGALKRVFDFCLVDASLERCETLYKKQQFDKMKSRKGPSSASIVWGGEVRRRFGANLEWPEEGFFGKGKPGSWKETWGSYERWCFDCVAGDLLADLGYGDEALAGPGFLLGKAFSVRKATRLWLRQILRRAKNRLSAI